MAERDKIAARIRALLEKTVANGCTEGEAVAAAAKAAELLARYNLTLDEIGLRAEPFRQRTQAHADLVGERLWKPASAIAELTGAVYFTSTAGVHPVEITFAGLGHEVEIATYLLEICARAMRSEQERLQRDLALLRPVVRRMRLTPHLDGMADRLRARIRALIPPATPGTGLIVLRDQLIREGLAAAGIEIESSAARRSRDHEGAYAQGVSAADQVALNAGLRPAGDAAPQLSNSPRKA